MSSAQLTTHGGHHIVTPDDAAWHAVVRFLGKGDTTGGVRWEAESSGAGVINGIRLTDRSGNVLAELDPSGYLNVKGQLRQNGNQIYPILQASGTTDTTNASTGSQTGTNMLSPDIIVTPTYTEDVEGICTRIYVQLDVIVGAVDNATGDDVGTNMKFGYRSNQSSTLALDAKYHYLYHRNMGTDSTEHAYSDFCFLQSYTNANAYFNASDQWAFNVQQREVYDSTAYMNGYHCNYFEILESEPNL